MQQFDVVIIGSGLGGLLSAVLLAKEGLHVAVIEQNKQVGGCLQTFSFQKKVFDSCVHYVGSLDPGQVQHRIFDYAGIINGLRLKKLDENGFDRIAFGDEYTEYPQAQGLGHFAEQLSPYFEGSTAALQNYTQVLKQVADSFPLYNLRMGDAVEKEAVSGWSMNDVMHQIKEERLQHILTGNNLLYAGVREKTPFYVHALVSKSYIDSAYKCVGGSSQIAKLLWRQLQEYGGVIFRNEKVSALREQNGIITEAVTESGNVYRGKNFIANVHPTMVLKWIDSSLIKPIYRKRIAAVENSISAFMINMVLQPGKVPFKNYNIYWNKSDDSYEATTHKIADWPANYALYYGEDQLCPGYADTVAILTYMNASEFEQWHDTHNRSASPTEREASYHEYKEERAALLLDTVARRYPELKANLSAYQVATPLTFRDYMGTDDGSIYGIMPDVNNPAAGKVPIRTKIPNLLLTGQNVNLHGVLGVSITAVATCGELLGLDFLLNKINKT
jgi:all-trans-retinol 13,14-reductase